eukprot:scaffold470567_cov35-Prasinocladus_malaysianus.AAC.1
MISHLGCVCNELPLCASPLGELDGDGQMGGIPGNQPRGVGPVGLVGSDAMPVDVPSVWEVWESELGPRLPESVKAQQLR